MKKKFRQQLDFADNPELALKLGMTSNEYRNFEIFITDLCDGYICDANFNPTINQTKDVIDQVIAGVEQL